MKSNQPKFALGFVMMSAAVWSMGSSSAPRPLKALLITGGCCHDYAAQKDILKNGLEARAHIVVDQLHSDDKTVKPPLAHFGKVDYAKGYDVVIHDECAPAALDPGVITAALAPHRKGLPGVNLHCAMHSYRFGDARQPADAGSERALWFEYLGIQSSNHGPQQPITITYTDKSHAITRPLEGWTTVNEELYNNIQILPSAKPLARGKQTVKQKAGGVREDDYVVTWVNNYNGARVFNTTIGHNNDTVKDPRYLDLVTRGVLWACGKLDDSYLKR